MKQSSMGEALKKSRERRVELSAEREATGRLADSDLQVVDGQALTSGQRMTSVQDSPNPINHFSTTDELPRAEDPWVPSSIKMRNSKKGRLHRLSRSREDAHLSPYFKQDLLDEAIDFILHKYGG